MRTVERERRVPMLDLGIIIISWWDAAMLEKYEALQARRIVASD